MSHDTRLVCAFVEPQETGSRFPMTDWPLHVTVVPWFKLKDSPENFNDALQAKLTGFEPFVAHVGSQRHTRFGAKHVSLLEPTEWQGLHEGVLAVVSRHAGIVATRLFIGPYYRPHVTFQKAGHLNPGDVFVCDSLHVVERHGQQREVGSRLKLGSDISSPSN